MHVILVWKYLENLLRYILIDWFGQLFGDALHHGSGGGCLMTSDTFHWLLYEDEILFFSQFRHDYNFFTSTHDLRQAGVHFKDTKNDISKNFFVAKDTETKENL